MSGRKDAWERLREKAFREHFVDAELRQSIPFQIRALMKAQGINQEELAKRAGLTQGAISRAANPRYGKLTLSTLSRLAAGFDVAFVGRFVPFSELDRWLKHLAEESANVPTFEEEDVAIRPHTETLPTSAQAEVLRWLSAHRQQGRDHLRLSKLIGSSGGFGEGSTPRDIRSQQLPTRAWPPARASLKPQAGSEGNVQSELLTQAGATNG